MESLGKGEMNEGLAFVLPAKRREEKMACTAKETLTKFQGLFFLSFFNFLRALLFIYLMPCHGVNANPCDLLI